MCVSGTAVVSAQASQESHSFVAAGNSLDAICQFIPLLVSVQAETGSGMIFLLDEL